MLELSMTLPIKVQNGGLFISRGVGRHPARRLESWEIIFVEKGRLTIQEEDHVFCVEAGESLLLWPRRRHIGVEDFPSDLRFYWLHFEVKAPDSDPRWLTHLSVPQHTRVADPQALIALFRQFMSEQEKLQRSPALEFIVLLILQQLTCTDPQNENAEDPGGSLAWKAQQLIRTQYHLPLSTGLLAKELHCNVDYLGRVYRRVFHLTLTEAIHRQRVREAEKLLISDARSLKEVAELCGFNDVGYFRQIFRKHTGLTPAVWKRRYCKEHINS
ncbi:AraC family transcriptional regulator [Citrobacter amalonaticus]|uniref:AraC family transcriptional regulator n=1 Tax=Citrobacter amalonaticus TaxID=35703 RepID=A0A2S4RV44_CITAM|nr:AraC family transcriptional regulator [Citrobacter amalonaticus]POT55598.1 AraC family transcriptional regulator [Citrobacter amalonaticus]POT73809.1 AraC family transcriptional regulator [Citrobacter amalonaticus]POU64034.1 AraC family transcriptional regulator [Citrobacter amalonaticus]POV03667.1 AraC family transcriptional regulator [Citrobacter amalonaticus]